MVVPDIEKAHDQLAERDGNKWAVQQLPQRG